MGKKVNCAASINLLENGLLSEITEEFVKLFMKQKHCSSTSSSQLQQRKMTSEKKTLMKQPWVANFTTFFLILCILYFPRSLPQNMLFRGSGNLNRRRERELFELKSFCVFIAEEEIKIPILFSSANSMAEGNLIWCFHLDYKFIEADEDFFSLLNSKLFPSPNKARLIYLSRLECVDPIIDVTISG